MNTHIHYLNLLILLATVYPVDMAQLIRTLTGKRRNKAYANPLEDIQLMCMMFVGYVSLIILVGIVASESIKIQRPTGMYWYVIAVAMAPLMIYMEYLVGYITLRLTGHRPKGMIIQQHWKRASVLMVLLTIMCGISEEIIFRQIWFYIMGIRMGIPMAFIMLITSLVYVLNHMYFGVYTMIQKMFTGMMLGILYIISGGSVLIPLIAHGSQNLIVAIMGGIKK